MGELENLVSDFDRGKFGRRGDFGGVAMFINHAVADSRGGDDNGSVEILFKPLLEHVHVQQP